jgi:hypothetical protein
MYNLLLTKNTGGWGNLIEKLHVGSFGEIYTFWRNADNFEFFGGKFVNFVCGEGGGIKTNWRKYSPKLFPCFIEC